MNGTTAQAITSSLVPEFVNLTISNTGNVVTTGVNLAISGNLSLSSGSFDLGEFTANRTAGGGTLSLSNNTLLRIGGSNSLPANYTTHVVGATNTVEYAGDGQVVSHFNSGQTYGHLKISGTAAQTQSDVSVRNDLTVTGSFGINANTIKVGGALSNSGVFIVANGTVELNGTAAQTIPASVFTGNNVKGLTINNTAGVTLAGSLDLTDVLTVSNGSLDAGGFLTLKSTSTATARIAPITSLAPSPITGVVNAERYVPGRRKYRLVTSPVTTSAESVLAQGQEELSIWGNWQNFGNNTSANAGNFITGGSSADGFDTQTPNASLFTYDDVNRKYVGYTSANGKNTKYTPLKAGIAYYMFVYGDRRNTITTSNPNSTVLTARGTVLTGDQAYHTTSTIPLTGVVGRYTMLGNPFASPIDWATIPKTNLANTYWGWDPNLSGTGGYVTVSTLGEITITSPMSGVTGINQYIQSGQAFFVKTTAASPTMTIREQDKVSNFNGSVFRTEGAPLTLIAANLQYTSGASRLLADGVVAVFDDNFSNSIGSEDASKMENTTEGLSISASGELLSIEGRRMPQLNDTIRLATARLTKPQYTLQLFTKEMGALTVAPFLYDSYQDTLVPILTTDTTRFDFSVNAALPASTDPNRFKIVFRKMVMLPVRFVSVKAEKKEEAVNVQWMVADESGIAQYDIERSDDGLNFRKAGEVAAGNNSHYNWLDTAPNTGNNYYRIRAVESGGNTILSNTVVVKMTGTAKAISVIPNPVTDAQIHLYLEVQERGVYTITLHDRGGRLVLQKTMQHPGGRARATIDASSMARGMYYLSVTIKDNKYTEQVLIDR
jgi:hypothetical protein